ncbi:MAG: DUF4139 domain-containing protein [Anaerolineae bacterium]|nr:DUF4139 domain-containing protein [Anaerolineae bacterium]
MIKKLVFVLPLILIIAITAAVIGVDNRAASAGLTQNMGGISYASLPDEAALYLNDMVFARDTVVLPNETVRVLLPPGTFPDTLILTENGARVRNYRVAQQGADVYYSQANFRYGNTSSSYSGSASYSVIWDAPDQANADTATREIKLEYLMSGASWTPSYDMQIVNDSAVDLAFFAEIHNTSLVLDETTLYLVAGRVDLSRQMDQVSQVTFNQMAVGYADTGTVDLPDLGVGAVDLQHIYGLGPISAEPGDYVYVNLVAEELSARRVLVWNATSEQSVNVIYKVKNDSEIPFAEGIVRNYQDKLFMGSDFIETTPPGSEGSVTVGSLPDVRVFRTESSEYHGSSDDYYIHSVELVIDNFSDNDLDLIVLDQWQEKAWQFEYSLTPERQQDNLQRWEVSIAAGESLTISYTYRTEY